MFINPMSDEEICDYKETFKFYDRKNRGYFTCEDFDIVTMNYGDNNPTYLKLRSIMEKEGYIDKRVDFPVFLYFMCLDRKEHVPLHDPMEAFCSFDKDRDGMISRNDLRHGMKLLGEPLAEEEIDKMVETFARFNKKIGFRSWELLPIVRKYNSFRPRPTIRHSKMVAPAPSSTTLSPSPAMQGGRLKLSPAESTKTRFQHLISMNRVIIFSRPSCCMAHAMKQFFHTLGVNPMVIELDEEGTGALAEASGETGGAPSVVFIGGILVGGLESLMALHLNNQLVPRLVEFGVLREG